MNTCDTLPKCFLTAGKMRGLHSKDRNARELMPMMARKLVYKHSNLSMLLAWDNSEIVYLLSKSSSAEMSFTGHSGNCQGNAHYWLPFLSFLAHSLSVFRRIISQINYPHLNSFPRPASGETCIMELLL